MNTRRWDSQSRRTCHTIKKHLFEKSESVVLDIWGDDPEVWQDYEHVRENPNNLFQHQLAKQCGVCQMTVSNWQRGIHLPRVVSKKLMKMDLPDGVVVTPELMKLFGFYTAEGRSSGRLEFVFGVHEEELIRETQILMREAFGLPEAVLRHTDTNSTRVIYYSSHLGRFFAKHCGNGSHNKHVPGFIWGVTKELFLSYLKGYIEGDGYTTKEGKLSATSVSRQLILELSWLCAMHGIKAGIGHEVVKGGRVINGGRALPDTLAWKLIIGKTSNPFLSEKVSHPFQFKRTIVQKVICKSFDGYVYDLCGVENEGFFGGEKPVLLHNSRARDLFLTAKKTAPSIIFIDEIDAIGRHRGGGLTGGHDEREQTLNQILVEMDGFTPNDNVIVLAATNRPDMLDSALTRPGRFDRRVTLDMPDLEDREKIIKIHARGKPFEKGIVWTEVARRTVGFSGADIENMLNEAAILTAREIRKAITMDDLEEAATKVKLGPEKKRLQSAEEREMTAYHEAGHAVVSHFLPKTDPVHRISIVSRGLALGYTLIPPKRDRYNETKSHLLETITSLLGGRAAEQLVFNELTAGAASDINKATRIARQMVIGLGMSDLGPIYFGPQMEATEWGRSWLKPAELSPDTQTKVDQEIKKIIDGAYKQALVLAKKHRKILNKVAVKLLVVETLTGEEFEKIAGKKTSKQ